MASTAYIGIGSNLGDSQTHCEAAINTLDNIPEIVVTQKSSLYKTEPLGTKAQDWFINAVVEIKTNMNPERLLNVLLKVEENMGRVRQEKWGSRIIDLDLLFYENLIFKKPELEIPHPEIPNRSFVLVPMFEICPNFLHPTLKLTITELLNSIPKKTAIQRLANLI